MHTKSHLFRAATIMAICHLFIAGVGRVAIVVTIYHAAAGFAAILVIIIIVVVATVVTAQPHLDVYIVLQQLVQDITLTLTAQPCTPWDIATSRSQSCRPCRGLTLPTVTDVLVHHGTTNSVGLLGVGCSVALDTVRAWRGSACPGVGCRRSCRPWTHFSCSTQLTLATLLQPLLPARCSTTAGGGWIWLGTLLSAAEFLTAALTGRHGMLGQNAGEHLQGLENGVDGLLGLRGGAARQATVGV